MFLGAPITLHMLIRKERIGTKAERICRASRKAKIEKRGRRRLCVRIYANEKRLRARQKLNRPSPRRISKAYERIRIAHGTRAERSRVRRRY